MKKLLLTVVALLALTIAQAQKTEYRISFNSGLFSFAGLNPEKRTFINFNDQTQSGYTNNPYGAKGGLCYGVSANIQRVTRQNFILGVDLGYETLRSKISIIGVGGFNGTETYDLTADGQTYLNSNFTNIYPFLGYRIMKSPVILDLTGGIDIAHCISAKEDGEATDSNGKKYETSLDRKTIKNEVRPRIQISTSYKKMGLYVGYSYGLANYQRDYIPQFESRAKLLRFGLTYQIH